MQLKQCFRCKETKPLNDFYKHPQMADGHLGKCKACACQDVQKNYQDTREAKAEYERRRYQAPARRKKLIEYMRKRRAKKPDQYKAHTAANNALRDGRIEKQPCECGCTEVEAHHKDYSKPLDVEWSCRSCHLKKHGKEAYSF